MHAIVDLFVTMFPGLTAFDLDDDVTEWYFKLHFHNFIQDWIDVVGNLRRWKKEDVEGTVDFTVHVWLTEYPQAIPEFRSFLILPMFMITTLLAVIVYRRKHATISQPHACK